MSNKNLVVAMVVRLVNQAVAPMKGLVSDLAKVGKTANTTAKPVAAVSAALKDTVAPAVAAAKSTKRVGVDMDLVKVKSQALGTAITTYVVGGFKKLAQYTALGAVSAMAFVATVVAGTVATARYVHSQTELAEATLRAAQSAGLAVKPYQRVAFAFRQFDLNADVLDGTIRTLSRNMVSSIAGSKQQAATFKALGISVKDANGKYKAADVILEQVADKFATMKNNVRKATIAQNLFGESGTKLIPLLNKGSTGLRDMGDEAEKLGLVLDEKTIEASQKFDKAWNHISNTVDGARNSIWIGLLPALTTLVNTCDDLITKNKGNILKGLTVGIDWLNVNLPSILTNTAKFITFISNATIGVIKFTNAVGGFKNIIDIGIAAWIANLIFGLNVLTPALVGVAGAILGVEVAAWPITATIALIAGLAAGAYLLIRNWTAVKAWFGGFWSWMTKHWEFLPVIGPFIHLADLVIKNWSKVTDVFTTIGDTISTVFRGLVSGWNLLPSGVRNFISGVIGFSGISAPALPLDAATPSGPARSLADRGQSTQQGFSGLINLSIDSKEPVRVTKMTSSPGLDLGIDRGSLVGGN